MAASYGLAAAAVVFDGRLYLGTEERVVVVVHDFGHVLLCFHPRSLCVSHHGHLGIPAFHRAIQCGIQVFLLCYVML